MNFIIFITAIVFGWAETWYFGWNLFPSTLPEIICDSITAILFVLSVSINYGKQ